MVKLWNQEAADWRLELELGDAAPLSLRAAGEGRALSVSLGGEPTAETARRAAAKAVKAIRELGAASAVLDAAPAAELLGADGLAALAQGAELEPRQQFYYGRELYYHQRYEEAIQVFERFLDGGRGWVENNIDACCHCAYCHKELGHEQAALAALFRSFTYDRPRAEVCCEIGNCFLRQERYQQAAYWYALALTCARDDRRGGFVSPDCYGYLPCIQLCVCYSHLGDQKRAETFNELAAACKPDSSAVLHNRAIFQSLSESLPR